MRARSKCLESCLECVGPQRFRSNGLEGCLESVGPVRAGSNGLEGCLESVGHESQVKMPGELPGVCWPSKIQVKWSGGLP